MKKLYSAICGKFRKFEKPKISYILEKPLVLSIICSKYKNEDEKVFKEEETTEILKILNTKCIIVLKIWVKNLDRKI